MIFRTFNLQGHRGARGLAPENTLVSFEVALDAGVSSIETDLHLTRDGHVVLCHDPMIDSMLVRKITRKLLATYRVKTDRKRFPSQSPKVTPLARLFAPLRQIEPFSIPTLHDLIEFVAAYSGDMGQQVGKSADQRARAARLIFDLELKRVPGRPEKIGDGFDGRTVGELEKQVLECIRHHGVVERTVVRSFDHRCVRAIKEAEPRLRTAILIAATAPVAPEELVRQADASIYAPSADFLDEIQVKRLHAAGIAVMPWTVNEPADFKRFLAWGVDGMSTDYPDRLARFQCRQKTKY